MPPKVRAGYGSSFSQRPEFSKHYRRIDRLASRVGAEAAVGTSHDPLATDDVGIATDALCNQPWMLDEIAGRVDDAGHEHLVIGQLRRLPILPLVLVARI